MASDQMTAILALLRGGGAVDHGAGGPSEAGADAAAAALGVDGISAGVGTGPGGVVLSWGREKVSVELEGLEFTLGQGPGLEAVAAGVPVLVPDLLDAAARWPALAPAAAELGVRAVFAFPLRIGAISVGALIAHRDDPGPLAGDQLADALVLADAVTMFLLHRQNAGPSPAGSPARPFQSGWEQTETYRAEVHQATGMISVQLGVSLAEALARLRAHAYGNERPIAQVATDVVARRLRFDTPT
jgi:GAF domain-containing protein